eukprot:1195867-Prorocentrum_minimum.AAC.3
MLAPGDGYLSAREGNQRSPKRIIPIQPADPAAVAQWRGRCHSHTVTQLHSHTFTRFRGNSLSPRLLEATRLAQSHCAVAVASG